MVVVRKIPEAVLGVRFTDIATESLTHADIERLLDKGFPALKADEADKALSAKLTKFSNMKSGLAAFANSREAAITCNQHFAMLLALRSRYGTKPPILHLGTILESSGQETGTHKYWLCLQALCDSVRILDSRPFPLLPLEPVVDNSSSQIMIVNSDGRVVRLKVSFQLFKTQMIEFLVTDTGPGTVTAAKDSVRWKFKSSDGTEYVALGELRDMHAQRIANRFAPQASRVGVTESEWLRTIHGAAGLSPGDG